MGFDPEGMTEHLNKMLDDVGTQAFIDQQAAALNDLRDNGTWWAALSLLGGESNNIVATALATQHLKEYLHMQDRGNLVMLSCYLLHNTITLVANQFEDGDITAAVKGIVSDEDFACFEKFVATSGASCPNCGDDDGWNEHVCKVAVDDSLEG